MTSFPSGWFPDQSDPEFEVFWDGSRWTGERRAAVAPFVSHASDEQVVPQPSTEQVGTPDAESTTHDTPTSSDPAADRLGLAVRAFFRSARGRWVAAGLVMLLLLAVAVPAVVGNFQTQQREQAAAREADVRAARLAVEARSSALVSRQSTLEEAWAFLGTDLSYAPEGKVGELKQAVEDLEDMKLTDAPTINSAVQKVKNGKTNVGTRKVPYTWSLNCTDFAYRQHDFANFREVWKSPIALSRCEADTRSGDFFSDEHNAAVASGAVGSLNNVGTLESICGELGFSTYAKMTSYSESQAKELYGALTICPDHPKAGEVRTRLDASLAEAAALSSGNAFGSGVKRVGQDVQPGTYVTEGTLDGCYWERTDGAGEIIDNNFISNALRAEVTIRPGDYSFTSTSCGTWKKQ